MTRRRTALLGIAAAVLAALSMAVDVRAQAPRRAGAPPQLGARTVFALGGHGYFMPGQTDSYPLEQDRTQSLRFDGALQYDIALLYGFSDRLIEFSVGQTTTTLSRGGTRAHVTMRPLLVTGLWRWYQPRRFFIPYFGVGAGVYRMRVRPTSSYRDTLEDANPELDELEFHVDDVIGVHVAAGVELLFAERFAATFDARYPFLRTHARIEGTEIDDNEEIKRTREVYLRLDGPIYGVGLRVYF